MRTAIYCRVSSPGQKNTTSLPEQERINRERAAQLGWQISEPHVYHEVEGGEDLYRPCMDRLWDAIQAHEVDAVVIDVLDRLSRDEGDQGAVYHHADRHGVVIELASQDYDETEQGRTLRFIAGLHARMEHTDIRRRTQRGRLARAASGKLMTGGFPLYGYQWGDPEKGQRSYYVVDPETAPVVVFIFESVAAGIALHEVMRQLEARRVPTPYQMLAARGQLPKGRIPGPFWHHGTIVRMLQTPAYWGEHAVYRRQHITEKVRPAETGITRKVRHTRLRSLEDPARIVLSSAACPPLVSRELAERVHARLRENKAAQTGGNPDPLATIWRGMVRCGHCEGRMVTGTASRDQGRCYLCKIRHFGPDGVALPPCPGGKSSILAKRLDRDGWADVLTWLSDEENVARLFADWQQERTASNESISSRLEAVAATLAGLRAKMDALAETIAETTRGESRRTLQEKLDTYADQVTKEEQKRERLLREASEAADIAEAQRDVRAWVQHVVREADTFTREEQRATLQALGAVATVWRADYSHPDGWPQRYKITLHFTGFTGQPVVLPPTRTPDANYL